MDDADAMKDGPILLLGGTGEARALAQRMGDADIAVISSLAGRVRDPRLPVGDVRIGGFGGIDGLTDWIQNHHVIAVVDATHPFATTMTDHAATVADRMALPLLRVRRPAWTPTADDSWVTVPDIRAAAREIDTRAVRQGDLRVFLTTGRQDVGVFAGVTDATFLIRVVDPPTADLPPRHRILRSRGPYDLSSERELMRANEIDVLVTKNSGGELTRAKLTAAAALGVDVVMVDRPAEPASGDSVDSVAAAMDWVLDHLAEN
ncbi:cobalt-precorrin-6A reductase [Gordonia sp. DT218]|uniref:cobalt-precorrin-6A reductase n=1 Tax=unclassified Gordonia (in: high G+C Gram-positive bacteria) TaxID=2657482 RepID=UPI003CF4BABE